LQRSDEGVRHAILTHLRDGGNLTLFLDYDGTLQPIAPTPAEAVPDDELLELLTRLSVAPRIRTVILSGRPLADLRRMLRIQGLLLGGLYGVEMLIEGRVLLREAPHNGDRESLNSIRKGWTSLLKGRDGFLLEDKGRAIALHARWADPEQAMSVLAAAREITNDAMDASQFRILDGDRYLEVAPLMANKGETVDWLLAEYPVSRDLPVGFGDDNKDEAAFAVIQRRGGIAIGVGHRYPLPGVDLRLESPKMVRAWLESFLQAQ